MIDNDLRIIEKINKATIIYDYDSLDGRYSSVCIDNESAIDLH